MIQRRLYLYIVGAASLGMLLVGLSNLGLTAVDQLLKTATSSSSARDAYASFGAVTLVGLPVWAIHWGIAQRLAFRRPDERASALRRLYLYLVLGSLALAATIFLRQFLEGALNALGGVGGGAVTVRSAWVALILLAFCVYHFRVAAADRAAVGEDDASATLRRWYAYALLLFGLAFLLFGARNLLQQLWVLLADRQNMVSTGGLIPSALATTLAGLVTWGVHSLWTSSPAIAEDDRRSTLRAVSGFLALASSVILALVGASQLLYYVLDRVLGVANPGGLSSNLIVALASPGSTLIVFAFAWVWLRRQLAQDAGESEAARQAGVRRVYTHLVAFLALGTLAIGTAGLLWTLSDQVLNPLTGLTAGEWRDRTSLFVTLALVGTPMWLTHWRPNAAPAERHTLSRRLYLYAVLLASVLALLISAATLLYRLLGLVLGTSSAGSGAAVVDIGRAASVIAVAVTFGLYHWRVLRLDGSVRPAVAPAAAQPAPQVQVAITGATEAEVRRLLGGLPEGATYRLESGDPGKGRRQI